MKRIYLASLLGMLSALAAFAKSEPPIVMLWPPEKPALQLTFDKFREEGSYSGQHSYHAEVTVKNLTEKQIPRAMFTVYFLDKSKVRIGQGTLQVADLEAGQSAKMQFQFNSVGAPASLSLSAKTDMLAAKTIPLRVVSVPPGAKLKVDGADAGSTPVMVRLTVGSHQLDLSKEGYAPGGTPVEVTADELPGGSITVELGGISRDAVELRDGTVLLGDVISMSMNDVVLRADGKEQKLPRNQVKKIILVERVNEQQPTIGQPPAATQSRP
jgi:PEGA domain